MSLYSLLFQTSNTEAMTCQELLALSGALSAALPTGQLALDSLFTSLSKGVLESHFTSQFQFPETHDVGCGDRLVPPPQMVRQNVYTLFQII